jgi:hypothetical protein
LCIAAQPAEKVTEQIMRLDVLRFGAENGLAKPYGIVEPAGLKCRHRVRKSAIHRRSSSQHLARPSFKIRLSTSAYSRSLTGDRGVLFPPFCIAAATNQHNSSDTNRSASKQESVFFMPRQKNSIDRNKFHRAGPLRLSALGLGRGPARLFN